MKNLIFCIIKKQEYKETTASGKEVDLRVVRTDAEKFAFLATIKNYKNLTEAAKAAGIKRPTAAHWRKKYGMVS